MKKRILLILFSLYCWISFLNAQNPWVQKAPYPAGPIAATVGFSIGHYGFIGCGTTIPNWNPAGDQDVFWRWDEFTNTWTQIANYPGGPIELATGFTIEGKGYVCFGWNGAGVRALYRYDTISNAWSQMATFPGTARYDVSAFVIGHKAYIIEGNPGGPPYLSDVWVYDAHTNAWKQLNNFPVANLEGVVSFSIGNHGYAGDGYYNPGCSTSMFEYDTTSDTWTPIAPIPVPYGDGGNSINCTIGSRGYVFNGDKCNVPGIPTGYMYDTVTKGWCAFTDMSASTEIRAFNSAFVINNHIYMGTGYDTIYHNLGDFLEYLPSTKIYVTDTTLCLGDSVHFSDSTSYLGTSWNWSFPGGSPATSNLKNPAVVYSSSGPYTVQLILSACGGVDTVSRIIHATINPGPHVTITGSTSNCAGIPDTLAASGGGTYTWSNGATTSSIIVSPSTNTIYTLAVTNGCTKDTSLQVQVIPLPSITFSANTPICEGDSSTITATGGGSYQWSTGATTSIITVKPANTTTYSVVVTNISGSCQKDSTIKITVNPLPTISLSGSDTVCSGNFTTLSASGGTSYLWSTGATTSSITKAITSNSTYTVQVNNGGCSKDTTINVVANPLPIVSLAGNNILCTGDSTTLSASGGTTYTWSTSATTSAITVKPASTTTYTVGVSNGTCVKDTLIKVTVNPLPSITVSGPNTICLGDSSTLTASGGGIYLWSTSSTSSAITVKPISNTTYTLTVTNNNCSKDTTITITVNTLAAGISGPVSICMGDTTTLSSYGGGTYLWSTGATVSSIMVTPNTTTTYTATITKGACVKDTTVTVTVNPLPTVSISGNNKVCKGDSETLTASGGTSYLWSSGQTTSSIIIIPTTATTYTVIEKNSFGCKKDTLIQVTVATPSGSVSGPVSLCQGDSAKLVASGGGTYSWSTGSTKSSIYVKPTANTTYTVIINNGCADTISTSLSIYNPILFACCDTTILTPGTSVMLQASGVSNYSWSPDTGISCTSCPNPIVSPTVTTTYTVIGTDSAGCRVERTITVDVSSCLDVSAIPNVFTPNGDTKNDVFFINAQSVSDYSIIIYDRWGKTMFSSSNPFNYWNGTNQKDNNLVSDGVYYYILKFTCNNKSYTKDGFIQVIR